MPEQPELVLAFDFGLKHIGVARGQRLTGTASPLPTLQANQGKVPWRIVAALIATDQPTTLVVGLHLNMDGSTGPITEPARAFAQWLAQRSRLPVRLVDERLSSVAANQRLHESRQDRSARPKSGDNHGVAACVIAESYFRDGASEG